MQKLQKGCLTAAHSGARKGSLGPLEREKQVSWEKMAHAEESVCTDTGMPPNRCAVQCTDARVPSTGVGDAVHRSRGERAVHRCRVGCSAGTGGAVHRCRGAVQRYRGTAGQGELEMEVKETKL